DKFNRAGRFYAHAFVVGSNEFRKLDNDPFAVLDQVTFQSSPEDGEKAGDPAKGTLPVVSLEDWAAKRDGPLLDQEKLRDLLPPLLRACGKEKPLLIGIAGPPSSV